MLLSCMFMKPLHNSSMCPADTPTFDIDDTNQDYKNYTTTHSYTQTCNKWYTLGIQNTYMFNFKTKQLYLWVVTFWLVRRLIYSTPQI